MGCEPSGQFITSTIDMKFDDIIMFKWQRYSQHSTYFHSSLLTFLDLHTQATESLKSHPQSRRVSYLVTQVNTELCPVCKSPSSHPLYSCPKLTHDQMLSAVKNNGACMNCLRLGHVAKQCTSLHKCRRYQSKVPVEWVSDCTTWNWPEEVEELGWLWTWGDKVRDLGSLLLRCNSVWWGFYDSTHLSLVTSRIDCSS